jgi:hypothetical protein
MSNKPKGLPAEIPSIRKERTLKEKHRAQRDASRAKRAQAKPSRDSRHQERWQGRDEQVRRILCSLHGVKPARQPIWVAAARLHWRLGMNLEDVRDAILSVYRKSRKAKVLVYKALKDVSRRQRKEHQEGARREFEELEWISASPLPFREDKARSSALVSAALANGRHRLDAPDMGCHAPIEIGAEVLLPNGQTAVVNNIHDGRVLILEPEENRSVWFNIDKVRAA